MAKSQTAHLITLDTAADAYSGHLRIHTIILKATTSAGAVTLRDYASATSQSKILICENSTTVPTIIPMGGVMVNGVYLKTGEFPTGIEVRIICE